MLVLPEEAQTPVLVVGGLLLAGGLYFLGMLIFDREALETEPGDGSVLEH